MLQLASCPKWLCAVSANTFLPTRLVSHCDMMVNVTNIGIDEEKGSQGNFRSDVLFRSFPIDQHIMNIYLILSARSPTTSISKHTATAHSRPPIPHHHVLFHRTAFCRSDTPQKSA